MARPDTATSRSRGTLWVLPLMLVLSFALNWPYLGAGFVADEVVILEVMEEDPLPYSRWRGAWSGDGSDLKWFGTPWWADPGAMGSFFRPIPSLVFEGSLRLFGKVAFPLHCLAIALHGVIGFLLALVLVRLCASRGPPVLAGMLWVACEDHSMTVGYPSFVTDILCVFFIMLALLAHLAWLRERRPLFMVGALAAILAALGCKETAAVAPLVLVVTSLFFPSGGERAGEISLDEVGIGGHADAPVTARWLFRRAAALARDPPAWAPWIALLVGFLGAYKALGLGGMDNLAYTDPLARPGRYLAHLVLHLPVMWLATITIFPPGLGFVDPATFAPMAVAGVVAFALLIGVLGSRLRHPVVAWGMTLYLLALLPQLGTDAGERLLYLPFAFVAIAFALLVADVGPVARRLGSPSPVPSRWRRVGGWYALLGLALPGLVLSALWPFEYVAWSRPALSAPLTAARYVEPGHERIVFLTTSDFFALIMVPTLVSAEVGRDLDVRVLSAVDAPTSFRRVGDRSFLLRMDRRGWLTSFLAAAFRRDPGLEAGAVYHGDLFDVTLVELTESGDDVLAARFDMHQRLDDPGTLFLRWDGDAYAPLDPGAIEVGADVPLRRPR